MGWDALDATLIISGAFGMFQRSSVSRRVRPRSGRVDRVPRVKYGRVGMLAFPYFFFLEVFGPIIESVGYPTFLAAVILGRASMPYVLAFLAVAFAFGIALSFAAVGLQELSFRRYPRFRDLVRLLGVAIIENVGYRQSVYVLARAWNDLEADGSEGMGRDGAEGIQSDVRGAGMTRVPRSTTPESR